MPVKFFDMETKKESSAKKVATKTAKKAATKRPTGRPSSYTPAIAERICEQIATTTLSLRRICEADPTLPSSETVRRWLYHDVGGFRALYAHAKEQQQELQEDELLDIADDGSNDIYVDDEGRPRVDHDHIQRSKLRIETRKWLMAKLKPKKYGEKVDVNHGSQPENPLTVLLQQVQGTQLKPADHEE